MVIASGGDLDAIKQAVGVVAKALERAGLAGPDRPAFERMQATIRDTDHGPATANQAQRQEACDC
jgi:hypothetical protein